MTLLVLRKLLNNRWMFLCLLIGFLVVATVVSSIPIFTDGILQRVLILDLQEYQASYNQYPGHYEVSQNYNSSSYMTYRNFKLFDEEISHTLSKQITVPTLADVTRVTMTSRTYVKAPYKNTPTSRADVVGLTDFQDKVTVLYGRMLQPGLVDGCYEVVVSEYAMKNMLVQLNGEYMVSYPYSDSSVFASGVESDYFRIRVVGVVAATDIADPYWFYDMTTYNLNFFMDYDTLVDNFADTIYLTDAVWYKAYDYTQIEISDIRDIINTLQQQKITYADMGGSVRFTMPTLNIMEEYLVREKTLQVMLWVLILPVLILLCFYIFMVSRLKLENETNEIAVLKSRGASRMQIFGGYIFEWAILGGISLLVGPWLGYLTCYFLGSSNGFLDFVSRTALPINMSFQSYLYAAAAVVLFAVAMLIPAFSASKLSIVEHKQLAARTGKMPIWQKFGFDVILIAVSVYGRLRYENILNSLSSAETSVSSMGIDPLMFLITSCFMLGVGMLFLRLYPYLVRLIFLIGKKRWSPALYSSFIRIGRSSSKEIFVMLFIIYSISVGIFSANSARTINSNLEDRYEYLAGTDAIAYVDTTMLSEAPDTDALAEHEGVDAAATVIAISAEDSNFKIKLNSQSWSRLSVMGIDPYTFSRVATMRSDLLPYHINEYLNLINGKANALLLSSDMEQYLSVGDVVTLTSSSDTSLSCVVYGFVDYWPGYEPIVYDDDGVGTTNTLIVTNLSFLQRYFPNAADRGSYQLWIKRSEGGTIDQVTAALRTLKLNESVTLASSGASSGADYGYSDTTGSPAVTNVKYTSQSLVRIKNDPTIQGFNGMLSLVFIITMGITTIGFLIYWILSLKSRTLQFGIYRAIGMSQRSIIGMLGMEQILVSLCAILFGLLLGDVTSLIYINLFEMVYTAQERVIPFEVFHVPGDYYKIYAIIALMLGIGLAVLIRVISSIKIDQALKLGED